ncbi:MAG: tripartite tricarboxylate transporter TctB family protein [Deltaproteobacteria bacterium]
MDQRNLISSVIFFLLAAFILILSVGLGIGSLSSPQSGFMPFWASMLIMLFSLLVLVTSYFDRSFAVRWQDLWHNIVWQKSMIAAAGLAVYTVLLPWAGYPAATGILMIVLFRLNAITIRRAVLGAALSVGVTYGLFHFLLKIPLPRGIWGF